MNGSNPEIPKELAVLTWLMLEKTVTIHIYNASSGNLYVHSGSFMQQKDNRLLRLQWVFTASGLNPWGTIVPAKQGPCSSKA